MSGTSQEQEKLIAQCFELLDELQKVNKENASLRKQLANGVASMANIANIASDPVSTYRPRGIGPKSNSLGPNLQHSHYGSGLSLINFMWIWSSF